MYILYTVHVLYILYMYIYRHYVNIQYLSIANCVGFTTAGVYYFMVGKGLHKLSHLDISGCHQVTTVPE